MTLSPPQGILERPVPPGSVISVELEESWFWSSDVPPSREEWAGRVADELRLTLAEHGIAVQILGHPHSAEDGLTWFAAVWTTTVLVEVQTYQVPEWRPEMLEAGFPLAAFFGAILAGTLIGGLAVVAWDVEAFGEAADAVGERAEGITRNLAIGAVAIAAIYLLPR